MTNIIIPRQERDAAIYKARINATLTGTHPQAVYYLSETLAEHYRELFRLGYSEEDGYDDD